MLSQKKLDEIVWRRREVVAEWEQPDRIYNDERRLIEDDIPALLAHIAELERAAEAAADVVKWDAVVQGFYRRERLGEEIPVSEISYANSEWSDAMDRLRAALATRMVRDERP